MSRKVRVWHLHWNKAEVKINRPFNSCIFMGADGDDGENASGKKKKKKKKNKKGRKLILTKALCHYMIFSHSTFQHGAFKVIKLLMQSVCCFNDEKACGDKSELTHFGKCRLAFITCSMQFNLCRPVRSLRCVTVTQSAPAVIGLGICSAFNYTPLHHRAC